MANDRIYLQCNVCWQKLYLGKCLNGGFWWANYGKYNGNENSPSLEDRLNKFYDDHFHPEAETEHWHGDYSIVYEMDNSGNIDEKWRSASEKSGARTSYGEIVTE